MYSNTRNELAPFQRLQIGVAFFAFILIGATDSAIGVLLPSIGAHYLVNKATVGLLFLAGTAGYLPSAFSSGLLVTKLGYRLYLMLGAAAILLGTLIFFLTPPFWGVLLASLVIGFGGAIIDAGLNSYIAGFPHNTKLLNYLHAFYGTGALLGPLVASTLLATGWQWNRVYLVWIGISLLLLAGFGTIFHRRHITAQEDGARAERNVLTAALKLRIVWIAALFLLFYVGTEVSLGNWSYSFLTEERRQAPLLSGWTVSGYWLGLTLGRLLLGKLAERVGNTRLIQGCLFGVAVGIFLVWIVPLQAASSAGLWLVGFSLGPIFPTTIALISKRVPEPLLPSVIGFLASLGSMGAALFPWLAGIVAQAIGLWALLPFVIVLTGIMLCFWLAMQPRAQPSTLRRSEEV